MRTLLLDGDIFAYKAAASFQHTVEWEPDVPSVWFDEDAGRAWMESRIDRIKETLNATSVVVALSDPVVNFRKRILPTYKHQRDPKAKPVGLALMKDHLRATYKTYERPTLEGDDVLGILATSKTIIKGEKIIVSLDKDMKTIPGQLYNDGKPELGVVEVSKCGADYWHLMQTLMGDATDGYAGCPGIGPKKAEAILEPFVEWTDDVGMSFNGNPWPAVVAAYAKAKLGPDEALCQARVARILRNTDYNFKTKEPILWTPPSN